MWGVRPVDVREAAARPVVWRARGWVEVVVVSVGVLMLAVEDFAVGFVEEREERVLAMLARLLARASGLMSGSCSFLGGLKRDAPLPRAVVLTLRDGSFRSRCCSGVRVEAPSWRYLKVLRFRDSTFCGSCSVTMSFRLKSSSLTRSRQFLALILSLSMVS